MVTEHFPSQVLPHKGPNIGDTLKLKNRKFRYENGKTVTVMAVEPENKLAHVSYPGEISTFPVRYSQLGPL